MRGSNRKFFFCAEFGVFAEDGAVPMTCFWTARGRRRGSSPSSTDPDAFFAGADTLGQVSSPLKFTLVRRVRRSRQESRAVGR